MKRFSLLSIAAVFFINTKIDAQEYIVPLDHNVHRSQSITNTANKPTANTLPFLKILREILFSLRLQNGQIIRYM